MGSEAAITAPAYPGLTLRGRVAYIEPRVDPQARNKLRLAQADMDRNRLLVDKGFGARKELIAAENQLEAVQNEIAGLERQIELARLASRSEVEGLVRQLGLLGLPPDEIERMRRERVVAVLHIPAPIGGTVVERPAILGQVVEPTVPLLKLVDMSVLIAEGSAPEDLLRELRVGQTVGVTVPTYPGERFEGRVIFIHPQIHRISAPVDWELWAEWRLVVGRQRAEGISLALFVTALRHIGTARTGAYFSLAPFFGGLLAVVVLREELTVQLVTAGALMAVACGCT